jgi:hypothetical protein
MPVNVMLQTPAIAAKNKLIGKLVTTSGSVVWHESKSNAVTRISADRLQA